MRRALPALPVAFAAVVAVVLLTVAPAARLVVTAAPALVVLLAGAVATAVWLLAGARASAARRREGRAVAAAQHAAEESRRRFIGRLDHELKNPLTALLAALAGEPGPLPAAQRALADTQAERIRRLLTDLRRVADAEVVDLEVTRVDVAAVLRDAVELAVDDHGGGRPVRLEVPTAPWPLPAVRGDADLLLVAVLNVVANALKYSGDDDVVEVRARETPGPQPGVTIEVADTGPGIPAEHVDGVWEELSRGAAPAGVPGSGIGLALVRTIVERHGGSTDIVSRTGAGTSVLLHLPGAS